MTDSGLNLDVAARVVPSEPRLRLPLGLIVLAIIWSALGVGLIGGAMIHASRLWSTSQPLPAIVDYIRTLHIAIVGMAAVAGAYGLLAGGHFGWWLAITFCYVAFSSFVVVSAIHGGMPNHPVRWALTGAACVAVWVYLHNAKSRRYFGLDEAIPWRRHVAVFLLTACAILAISVW